MNLGTTTFELSSISGLVSGDLSNMRLYYDFNSDGQGDSLIGTGQANISGGSGSISFATSTNYTATTTRDFVLSLTASNLAQGDSLSIDFGSASTTGAVSARSISPLDEVSSAVHTVPGPPTISSAANQAFRYGQSAAGIQTITVTAGGDNQITAAGDIRVAIASTSVRMKWDTTDTAASIGGTAAAKVSSSVSYEGEHILVINVTSDLSSGEYITISGLSFTDFSQVNSATSSLSLHLSGAWSASPAATDSRTVTIYGSLSIQNHPSGQVQNRWAGEETSTSSIHFRFTMIAGGENISVGTTSLALTGINGVVNNDISQALVRVDSSPYPASVSISGSTGTVIFATTTPYILSGSANLSLEFTVQNLAEADAMTINFGSVQSTGQTSGYSISPAGSVSPAVHLFGQAQSTGKSKIQFSPGGRFKIEGKIKF
jgi:hypothetical protein